MRIVICGSPYDRFPRGAFDIGENADEETIAMARYGLLDPADINEIGIDAEDHACRALARPRSIAALSLLKTLNAGETPGFRWLSEF